MKEIDFDELDRAVSSLMEQRDATQAEAASAPKPTAAASEAPTESSISAEAKTTVGSNEATTPQPPNEPSRQAVQATPTATVQPRRGRFMDMVHTSSDMRQSTEAVRSKPSRQGVTITPPAPSPEDNTATQAAFDPMMKPAPVAEETTHAESSTTSDSSDTSEPATHEWPDPIDTTLAKETSTVGEQPAAPDGTSTEQEESETVQHAEQTDDVLPERADEAPATPTDQTETTVDFSPFISGAKVEKRPLGGSDSNNSVGQTRTNETIDPHELLLAASTAPDKVDKDKDNDRDQSTVNDGTKQNPPEPRPQLPEELHDDLMAVEADDTGALTTPVQPREPTSASVKTDKQPKQPLANTKQPITGRLPEHTVAPAKTYSGPVSIPQQYKEAPSSTSDDHMPIYDANHQPLQHPAKKKSGWWAVLAIVLLIIIGGGGAAVLYYAGIL